MSKDTGGPAFPVPLNPGESYQAHQIADGMTLRDHFAGQELAKMHAVACCDTPEAYERQAENCYRMADAMLAERAK